jgi:hypothetical protein
MAAAETKEKQEKEWERSVAPKTFFQTTTTSRTFAFPLPP